MQMREARDGEMGVRACNTEWITFDELHILDFYSVACSGSCSLKLAYDRGRGLQKRNTALSIEQDIALGKDSLLKRKCCLAWRGSEDLMV